MALGQSSEGQYRKAKVSWGSVGFMEKKYWDARGAEKLLFWDYHQLKVRAALKGLSFVQKKNLVVNGQPRRRGGWGSSISGTTGAGAV